MIAETSQEKNPPAYLYDNERAGFESVQKAPESNPFMIGKNAQVIYNPNADVQFPFMFMYLSKLIETSTELNDQEKQSIQQNLQEIHFQLTGKRPIDESELGNAFQSIWEVSLSYADALIESLQKHVDELPLKTQDFIIQLHSPHH